MKSLSPSIVAIEKVFVNTNPQSTLLLGQARGAAIAAIVSKEINIYEYTALQIKKSVVGNGHADKLQVQTMVQRLLNYLHFLDQIQEMHSLVLFVMLILVIHLED